MAKLTQPEGGPPGLALGPLPPGPGLSAPHRASQVAEQSGEPGESNELCFVFLRESLALEAFFSLASLNSGSGEVGLRRKGNVLMNLVNTQHGWAGDQVGSSHLPGCGSQ